MQFYFSLTEQDLLYNFCLYPIHWTCLCRMNENTDTKPKYLDKNTEPTFHKPSTNPPLAKKLNSFKYLELFTNLFYFSVHFIPLVATCTPDK